MTTIVKFVDYTRAEEAVEVRPGRWVWPAVEGGWIIRFNDRHGDCHNHPLPGWWEPNKRYAVWDINSGCIVPSGILRGSALAYQGVTVDLETGTIVDADLSNVPREQFIHDEVPA